MNRYSVKYCEEGGTLSDSEGNNIDHTWDVIDRTKDDGYGNYATVSNHDTRESARRECRELNRQDRCPCVRSMGCLCAHHATGGSPSDPCNADEEAARLKASPPDPNANIGVSGK